MLKKAMLAACALALTLSVCAAGEEESAAQALLPQGVSISVGVTEAGGSHLELPEAVLEAAQDAQTAEDAADDPLAALNVLIRERLGAAEAMQISQRAGAQIMQTARVYDDGRLASIALLWEGTQADGMDGCSVRALSLDLETGGEIGFDALFDDPEAAVSRMEAIIEEEIVDGLSDYMEYADLLPMPRDCFSFDENGLTVYYPEERYRYFGGKSGAVHFAWFEIAQWIGGESPVYALSRSQAADEHALIEQLSAGRFPGAMGAAAVGERLGDVLGRLTLLSDPDYTDSAKVYLFEEPQLRGFAVEIPKYAETAEADTPVSAIRCARISMHGLETGDSLREDVLALLGEPSAFKAYDGGDAADAMLEPGESLFYEAGDIVLEAHLDALGVLSCLILHDAMPEGLY